jgi:hypothetical protein
VFRPIRNNANGRYADIDMCQKLSATGELAVDAYGSDIMICPAVSLMLMHRLASGQSYTAAII